MNVSTYVFGNFSSGLTAYPNENVIESVSRKSKAKLIHDSLLVVHRDMEIIHYCYLIKLKGNQTFGLGVSLNGALFKDIERVFSVFEGIVGELVNKGELICYSQDGNIVSNVEQLHLERNKVDKLRERLMSAFEYLENEIRDLPPHDYSKAKGSEITHSLNDSSNAIFRSTYQNSFTFISKEEEIESTKSFRNRLKQAHNENTKLQKQLSEAKTEIAKLKHTQKNMTWVSILGVLVAILGVIVYFKVINPSEVTHYDAGEFVYYGPMNNKKPHGTGVALYPEQDTNGRKYYIGNFTYGERHDTMALLLYRDGSYFFGTMDGDSFEEGIFWNNEDNSHYQGTFKNNVPYNGKWYDHVHLYNERSGKH